MTDGSKAFKIPNYVKNRVHNSDSLNHFRLSAQIIPRHEFLMLLDWETEKTQPT